MEISSPPLTVFSSCQLPLCSRRKGSSAKGAKLWDTLRRQPTKGFLKGAPQSHLMPAGTRRPEQEGSRSTYAQLCYGDEEKRSANCYFDYGRQPRRSTGCLATFLSPHGEPASISISEAASRSNKTPARAVGGEGRGSSTLPRRRRLTSHVPVLHHGDKWRCFSSKQASCAYVVISS